MRYRKQQVCDPLIARVGRDLFIQRSLSRNRVTFGTNECNQINLSVI